MKYLTLWFVALFGGLSLAGQATKEEMLATPEKTAGVYYAYPAPKEYVATPPPKGYVPFYISHFGRHGSRFLLEETEYTEVLALMEKAEAADALTPLGKDALQRLRRVYEEAEGHAGDLSPLGIRQHRGIAERMYEAYPEVFANGRTISARSSVILRCAMSMAAFGDRLKELNPRLSITYESSQKYMAYLTYRSPQAQEYIGPKAPWRIEYEKFRRAQTHTDRFIASLFSDQEFVLKNVDPIETMWDFYWVASDMQNVETPVLVLRSVHARGTFRPLAVFQLLVLLCRCQPEGLRRGDHRQLQTFAAQHHRECRPGDRRRQHGGYTAFCPRLEHYSAHRAAGGGKLWGERGRSIHAVPALGRFQDFAHGGQPADRVLPQEERRSEGRHSGQGAAQ